MLKRKHLFVLLGATFTLKLALSLYFSHLAGCENSERKIGMLAITGGDTFSYLGSIDNLINEGKYYFWNGAQKVSAGRMPYYGTPYFLLRLLFDQSAAYDIYVVIQVFFDALATVFFARLCFNFLSVNLGFWCGYLLYLNNFNITALNIYLSPESLSISFFVLFIYFYQCFWKNQEFKNAFWCGFFLAVITVLKPYFIILYPAVFICGWLTMWRNQVEGLSCSLVRLNKIVLIGLPLVILLSPWIVRNMIVIEKFIPAQENIWAGYNYSKSHIAFTEFAGAWGGGSVFWDRNDAGCYFLLEGRSDCDYSIPEYALADRNSKNQIENVRQKFINLQKNYSTELDDETASEFKELTNTYKQKQPFRYYIGSKFVFLKKLFWHTNNYNLPIHPNFKCFNSFQLVFKGIQFVIYFLALTLGVIGLLELTVRRKVSILFIIISLIIIVFFLELRTSEQRYVSQTVPLLLLGVVGFFCNRVNG